MAIWSGSSESSRTTLSGTRVQVPIVLPLRCVTERTGSELRQVVSALAETVTNSAAIETSERNVFDFMVVFLVGRGK